MRKATAAKAVAIKVATAAVTIQNVRIKPVAKSAKSRLTAAK